MAGRNYLLINTWAIIRGQLVGIVRFAWVGETGGLCPASICSNDARFRHFTNPLPSVLISVLIRPTRPFFPQLNQGGWSVVGRRR